MIKKKQILVASIVLLFTISASVLIYREQPDESNKQFTPFAGGNLTLSCELPSERPYLPVLSITCPNIVDNISAKTYAIQFYSQFNSVDFEEIDSLTYCADMDNGTIFIQKSGVIRYTIKTDAQSMNIENFSLTDARSFSLNHIANHGGIGQFSEYRNMSMSIKDQNGNLTGETMGYLFVYYRSYGGYPILGADLRRTVVFPGGNVSYYQGNYLIGEPLYTQQIISSATAWSTLITSSSILDPLPSFNISVIDICYCINERDAPISAMYPAWRFTSESGIELFVNAITGEYLND